MRDTAAVHDTASCTSRLYVLASPALYHEYSHFPFTKFAKCSMRIGYQVRSSHLVIHFRTVSGRAGVVGRNALHGVADHHPASLCGMRYAASPGRMQGMLRPPPPSYPAELSQLVVNIARGGTQAVGVRAFTS